MRGSPNAASIAVVSNRYFAYLDLVRALRVSVVKMVFTLQGTDFGIF